MPSVYCCVQNCNSSTYHLKKWKQKTCELHGMNFGVGSCLCEPRFQLFPFPREEETRKTWIRNVGRRDPEHVWKSWTPNKDSRVFSKHFEDGRPTPEHPYPTILMGSASRLEKGRRTIKRTAVIKTKKEKIINTKECESTPDPDDCCHPACDSVPVGTVSSGHQFASQNEHNYFLKCTHSSSTCLRCMDKEWEILKLWQKISELENELLSQRQKNSGNSSVCQRIEPNVNP